MGGQHRSAPAYLAACHHIYIILYTYIHYIIYYIYMYISLANTTVVVFLRNEQGRSAGPQRSVERNLISDWSSSPPAAGVAEKIDVVSICLRSAARSRKRRYGVCGCVKSTQHFFVA